MNDNFCLMVSDHLKSQDAKEERAHVRLWVGRVLALAALLFTTVYATGAYAQVPVHVHESRAVTIRLMPGPCVEPRIVMVLTRAGTIDRFKAIESTWVYESGEKKTHAGCWTEFTAQETGSKASFGMIFDDGERFVVPKEEFLKKPGQTGV